MCIRVYSNKIIKDIRQTDFSLCIADLPNEWNIIVPPVFLCPGWLWWPSQLQELWGCLGSSWYCQLCLGPGLQLYKETNRLYQSLCFQWLDWQSKGTELLIFLQVFSYLPWMSLYCASAVNINVSFSATQWIILSFQVMMNNWRKWSFNKKWKLWILFFFCLVLQFMCV